MSSCNVYGSLAGGDSTSGTASVSCARGRLAYRWRFPICTSSRGEGGRSSSAGEGGMSSSSYMLQNSLSLVGEGSSISLSAAPLATS